MTVKTRLELSSRIVTGSAGNTYILGRKSHICKLASQQRGPTCQQSTMHERSCAATLSKIATTRRSVNVNTYVYARHLSAARQNALRLLHEISEHLVILRPGCYEARGCVSASSRGGFTSRHARCMQRSPLDLQLVHALACPYSWSFLALGACQMSNLEYFTDA